jgi:hypothetical protein
MPRCVYCGGPAGEFDHLTGRDGAGRYIHPTLVWPSCPSCNKCAWRVWRAAGFDVIGDRHPVVVALRRLALSFARLGDCDRAMIELPASFCGVLAAVLQSIADWIERTFL